ncbi:MAG: MFS transporter [Acidimicrobiia bacterium]|nr:MFS transporter [Acidimicrobiia bacterium]
MQERALERRWAILAVLCFGLLVIVLDNSILNVALPTIQKNLDATSGDLQWIVDSYTLVFAGLLLTAGALGDRFGRRGALQIGFVLFGIGSVLAALSSTSGMLIGTRAFMGIGGALIMPATLSIITNVFPPADRAKAIGIWAGTAGLGGALGPLTGGFLVTHFYWGSVFLVNVPIVIIGLLAGVFLIPTSKDPSSPRLDPIGAVLSIVGLALVLYAIIEAPVKGWTSVESLMVGSIGLVVCITFVVWESRSAHPMLDISFFRKPRFTAAAMAITLVFFAMFGSLFLQTQYFQFVLGYSALGTGIRMIPFAAAMMIVAPMSAPIAARLGSKVTVALGLGLVTLGLLSLTQLQVDTPYVNIFWRLMLMSAGMGLTMAPATESVMGSLPLHKAGVGSAVNDTTRQIGGALGVAVIGSVLATTYGDRIGSFLAGLGLPLPQAAVDAATNNIGAVKNGLVPALDQAGAVEVAARVNAVADQAFVSAVHWGVLVAAAATAIGVVMVLVWLPARATTAAVTEQDIEFVDQEIVDRVAARRQL